MRTYRLGALRGGPQLLVAQQRHRLQVKIAPLHLRQINAATEQGHSLHDHQQFGSHPKATLELLIAAADASH